MNFENVILTFNLSGSRRYFADTFCSWFVIDTERDVRKLSGKIDYVSSVCDPRIGGEIKRRVIMEVGAPDIWRTFDLEGLLNAENGSEKDGSMTA